MRRRPLLMTVWWPTTHPPTHPTPPPVKGKRERTPATNETDNTVSKILKKKLKTKKSGRPRPTVRRNICAPQRRRRDGGGGGGGGGGGRRRRQIYRRFEYQTVAVRWTRREHENRRRADRHSRPWIFIPPASLVVWRFWHRKKKS